MMGHAMADDTLVALRRIVTLGVRLADTIDVYAWGLDREFAALRASCARGLGRTKGRDEPVRDAADVRTSSESSVLPRRRASANEAIANGVGVEACRDQRA